MVKGYDFDDLLLIPQPSKVNSRTEVSLEVNFPNMKLDFPIVASPMKGIVGKELIVGMSQLGGIGILHRFHPDFDSLRDDMQFLYDNCRDGNFGMSVKMGSNIEMRLGFSMGAKIICIDVANGYLESVLKYVDSVREYRDKEGYKTLIMAGNVVTKQGTANLIDAGVDIVRVGIGSGQLCTTRNYTGVGCPQLTAIEECVIVTSIAQRHCIADGGIRNSGDAVKALAKGADLIMMGSLFASVYESAHNGIIYGMASRRLQEEYFSSVKSVEGLEKEVDKTVSLKDFIDEFTWGIRSACTYMNARNLDELRTNATFIEVGDGSIKKGI